MKRCKECWRSGSSFLVELHSLYFFRLYLEQLHYSIFALIHNLGQSMMEMNQGSNDLTLKTTLNRLFWLRFKLQRR
jgi:hypothetical protein